MAEPSDKVKAAVMSLIAAQDAAWGAGDAYAFGASAAPDIVFTNVVGLFSVGLQAFNAQHAHIFSTIYQGSRLAQKLVHLLMVTEDVAIVDTLTAVTGYRRLPPGATPIDGAFQTRLEQVLVRRNGAWFVQSFHNVPVNSAALAVARPGADVSL